jgi:ATP-binding protein involved in chromosome partitioning
MKDDFSIKGEVIDALSAINAPGSDKNLVDAHVVEQLDVDGGVVDLTLLVASDLPRAQRFELEDAIYDALDAIVGVNETKIKTMTDKPEGASAASAPKPSAPAASAPASASPSAGASRAPTMPASAPVEGVGKVIAVASGKGGVGKSTVAVNLALALQSLGHRVGLLDIDIYGPSLPTLLGVNERPGVSDRRIVPLNVEGLRLMSLGFLMDEDAPVIWRGPIVTGIIRQFLRDVDWSGCDYLVVDMPPGTGDAQLALAQTVPVDGAVVVTTPSELALIDAARGLQMFKTLNVDVLGVVSNMSRFVLPDGSEHLIYGDPANVGKLAERLETDMLGEIPLDPSVRAGGDEGRPILLSDPDGATSAAFKALAARVAELRPLDPPGEDDGPKKKGLFSFLKS